MSDFYITFDNVTGDILGIENSVPENISYISASVDIVTPFLEGTEHTSSYNVTLDIATKQYMLKPRIFEETLYTGVNDILYEVPYNDNESDINIRLHKANNQWNFYLGTSLAKNLKEQKSVLQSEVTFYVTEFKNPNILFDILSVTFDPDRNITIDVDKNIDTGSKFSIYTKRRFETYGVKVEI